MFEVRRCVDSRLVAWTADMAELVPELAESWEVSSSAITFRLRKNAKWHDGRPITAEDVIFTLTLATHPDTGSRYNTILSTVRGYDEFREGKAESIAGLRAVDDHTVVLELTTPDSSILPQLPNIDILPKHVIGDTKPTEICQIPWWIEDNRVGSGPYKWLRLVEGQRIELEAFDDYFLGRPKIDRVNLLLFASYETSLAAFSTQESMACPLTVDGVEFVKALPFARIETQTTGVLSLFVNEYNPAVPLMADPRVRQAISYAIDRAAIAETLYKGLAAKPISYPLSWFPWVASGSYIDYTYDPERAKALLAEAGWNQDRATEFTLWYYYPDQVTASVVEAIQQYLAAVGIWVKPRLDEGGALGNEITNNTWVIFYGALGLVTPAELDGIYGCEEANPYRFCDDEFLEALRKGRVAPTEPEQQQYYRQAIQRMNELLGGGIWLFERKNIVAVNKRLDTGPYQAWSAGNLIYHNFIEQWTLKPA
jgi:peptide/nickel transport system substrate-binding protein